MLERYGEKGTRALGIGLYIPSVYIPMLLVSALRTTIKSVLKKLKRELLYNPAILLLGKNLEKTIIQKGTSTLMFTAALFMIARTWKQPTWPLTDEQIKKMWDIYTMEYSVRISSVAQSCPTLCDPMDCSTPGLPVHHQLPEPAETHVH